MNRDYIKSFDGIKLRIVKCEVTPEQVKKYGFLSKWRILQAGVTNNSPEEYGFITQKFTGNMLQHPGGGHRERVWLYDYTIDGIGVSGKSRTMNDSLTLLTDLLHARLT